MYKLFFHKVEKSSFTIFYCAHTKEYVCKNQATLMYSIKHPRVHLTLTEISKFHSLLLYTPAESFDLCLSTIFWTVWSIIKQDDACQMDLHMQVVLNIGQHTHTYK